MTGFRTASLVAVVLMAVAASGPARAASDEIDMTKVTCKQAGEMGADFTAGLIFWIDGYLSKEKDDPMMSKDWMDSLGTMVKDGCQKTPNQSMLKIVRDRMK